MTLPRIVAAETLDTLDAADPAARRSRRDLQRLHKVMATATIVGRAFAPLMNSRRSRAPLKVLELGAGDGTLLLRVARQFGVAHNGVELTSLDRQDLMTRETIRAYARLGWSVRVSKTDVGDWIRESANIQVARTERWDIIFTTLFLHHLAAAELAALFEVIESATDRFFACEPRRGWPALLGSRLVGVLGANAVTRNDAVLSVQAGFREAELRALWPMGGAQWELAEFPAGLFSHCFTAERVARKESCK
ncbi:conserved hypothetical protein [Burkholderia sp. 8Y]|uniref:methyltransferase domain-containing protein n=1 Tax=Burkholderia sp. 8Y TaxID=2653133 RepID=UPI0012F0A4FF|nr:methyltransferase domain-containing protein [Burkholderia sp. 8Y]VXC67388.1 conserved hypothetical protein [Burkholderia sp. 8Y]